MDRLSIAVGSYLLGRFRVVELIGAGNFGQVFRIKEDGTGREYAVKTPIHERTAFLEREVLYWLRLPIHPNVVTAYSADFEKGQPYLIIEYVRGGSLRTWLDSGDWSTNKALGLLRDIAEGMAHANYSGEIAHLDLKPENVLLTPVGTGKVTDFGLVRRIGLGGLVGPYPTVSTKTGTDRYRAPEVVLGKGGISQRSDVFSFGLIAYELLTGNLPFPRESALSSYYSMEAAREDVAAIYYGRTRGGVLRTRDGRLLRDQRVRSLLNGCLQLEPTERMRSFKGICQELERIGARSRATEAPPAPSETSEEAVRAYDRAAIMHREGDTDGALQSFNKALVHGSDNLLFARKALDGAVNVLRETGRPHEEADRLLMSLRPVPSVAGPVSGRWGFKPPPGRLFRTPPLIPRPSDPGDPRREARAALLSSVANEVNQGRLHTALEGLRSVIQMDPIFVLQLGGVVLGAVRENETRTAKEPPTPFDYQDPLFDPVAIECSQCRTVGWYVEVAGVRNVFNAAFMQCPSCRLTLCRTCLGNVGIGDVDRLSRRRCPDCQELLQSALPTSRTRYWRHSLVSTSLDAVVVLRSGALVPESMWLEGVKLVVSPDLIHSTAPLVAGAGGFRDGEELHQLAASILASRVHQGLLNPDALNRTEIGHGVDQDGVPFAIAKVVKNQDSFKPAPVEIKQTVSGVYEVYRCVGDAAALDFLRQRDVPEERYYVMVETQQRTLGRDLIAIFDEASGANLEFPDRTPLPEPLPSATNCARCGYVVMPNREPESVTSDAGVHTYAATLEEMVPRGVGFRCTRCGSVACASCYRSTQDNLAMDADGSLHLRCWVCGNSVSPFRGGPTRG